MKSFKIGRLLRAAVVLLAVVDLVGFVLLAVRAREVPDAAAVALRSGAAASGPPAGYRVGGGLDLPQKNERCWAVRYEASSCGHCANDDAHGWKQLAAVLGEHHCGIYILPPGPSRALLPSHLVPQDATQEILVSMSFLRKFKLTYTPTTLIFGPRGHLLWSRQTVLRRSDDRVAARDLARALAQSSELH